MEVAVNEKENGACVLNKTINFEIF